MKLNVLGKSKNTGGKLSGGADPKMKVNLDNAMKTLASYG